MWKYYMQFRQWWKSWQPPKPANADQQYLQKKDLAKGTTDQRHWVFKLYWSEMARKWALSLFFDNMSFFLPVSTMWLSKLIFGEDEWIFKRQGHISQVSTRGLTDLLSVVRFEYLFIFITKKRHLIYFLFWTPLSPFRCIYSLVKKVIWRKLIFISESSISFFWKSLSSPA